MYIVYVSSSVAVAIIVIHTIIIMYSLYINKSIYTSCTTVWSYHGVLYPVCWWHCIVYVRDHCIVVSISACRNFHQLCCYKWQNINHSVTCSHLHFLVCWLCTHVNPELEMLIQHVSEFSKRFLETNILYVHPSPFTFSFLQMDLFVSILLQKWLVVYACEAKPHVMSKGWSQTHYLQSCTVVLLLL